MTVSEPPTIDWQTVLTETVITELHSAFWKRPFVNRGIRDMGWFCRDHAWTVSAFLALCGRGSRIISGQANFVTGPSSDHHPRGIKSDPHSWNEVDRDTLIDVSPNLQANKTQQWPGVSLNQNYLSSNLNPSPQIRLFIEKK